MVKNLYIEEIVDRASLRAFLDQLHRLTGLKVLPFNEKGEPLFESMEELLGCPEPRCTDCPTRDRARMLVDQGLIQCRRDRLFKFKSLAHRGDPYGALMVGPFRFDAPPAAESATPAAKTGGADPHGHAATAVASVPCPQIEESRLQATLDLLDQFFAAQLEVALERLSVRRKEKILSVLEEASAIMNSQLDFQNLLEFLMDIAIDITGASCGALLLKKDRKNWLEVAVARGKHPQEVKKIRVPLGKGITGWVAKRREPLVVPNVLLEPRYIETPEAIYSEMAVPLTVGDNLIGVISVDSNQINAFSKDDCTTLTTLASMVTKVLENARLLAGSNQKVKELSRLFAVAETLGEHEADQNLLPKVLAETVEALACEAAALLWLDPENQTLTLRASQGLPADVPPPVIPIGKGIHGWVAAQRQPLLITDISKDLAFSAHSFLDQFSRSLLVVPLSTGERVYGVLGVYQKLGGHTFSHEDQNLLLTIGRQVTAHFENQRLFEDARQRFEHLNTLYQISNGVSRTLNPVRLFDTVLRLVGDVMRVETCSLMIYDPIRDYLTLDAAIGIPQAFIGEVKVPIGEGIAGWVARTRQPLLIKNIDKDERFPRRSSTSSAGPGYKTGSALSVPILHHERLLGVLNVNNKQSGRVFDQDDLKLLVGISDQIAQGIFNAILYEKTEQQVAELSLLQELGKAINSTLDLDSVLNYVIDMTTRITEADKSTLMLLDPESNELYVQVARGFETGELGNFRLHLGEGVAGLSAAEGKPMRILNTREDPDYIPLHRDQAPNEALSLISAPMLNKDKLIGVINCERLLGKKGPFTQENLDLLDTLASQASVAIENARLYQHMLNVYLETIRALAAAIDAKDSYTHGHSRRVTEIAVALSQFMGCQRESVDTIRHAALLHDVGKIGISEQILLKPGRLTDEEFETIKSHPLIGAGILNSIEFLKNVCQIIEHHHERFDGKGYPGRLAGEAIPLGSRIIGVADTFDAITSTRPYRKPLSFAEAEAEIARCAGSQFDPAVVNHFLRLRGSLFCPPCLREEAAADAAANHVPAGPPSALTGGKLSPLPTVGTGGGAAGGGEAPRPASRPASGSGQA